MTAARHMCQSSDEESSSYDRSQLEVSWEEYQTDDEYEAIDEENEVPFDLLRQHHVFPQHLTQYSKASPRRNARLISTKRLHTGRRARSFFCYFAHLLSLFICVILATIIVAGLFFPSYSNPPLQYTELRERVEQQGGPANIHNEKIFIAASLYDDHGKLLSGAWAESVLKLVGILGHDNVFLSVFENNPDVLALDAMQSFISRLPCESSISAQKLDYENYPHLSLPDGTRYLKRMQFLADVRNRALEPLRTNSSSASTVRFDKILYLNDVIFDPVDAANLLFSTHVDSRTGRANYLAACAVDFINPFKFYDTFATRDLQGYDMGVPFYPWFSSAGEATSRRDVLSQTDAVRVKSCWGGMVAFDAKYFLSPERSETNTDLRTEGKETGKSCVTSCVGPDCGPTCPAEPLRFRAEEETFWDSSECCLIHADLIAHAQPHLSLSDAVVESIDPGIYLNPYVRVAYSKSVISWLAFTRRFERLYPPIHIIANWIARRPTQNPRQFEVPGQEIEELIWIRSDNSTRLSRANVPQLGHYEKRRRFAKPGGFCGMSKMFYINEHAAEDEAKWGVVDAPRLL